MAVLHVQACSRRLEPKSATFLLVAPVLDGNLAMMTEEGHIYLSTACLHGEHEYCQAARGLFGIKQPATCKWCTAPCICHCHVIEESQ